MMRFSKIIAVLLLMPFGAMVPMSGCRPPQPLEDESPDQQAVDTKLAEFKTAFATFESIADSKKKWNRLVGACNSLSENLFHSEEESVLKFYQLSDASSIVIDPVRYSQLKEKINKQEYSITTEEWKEIIPEIKEIFGITLGKNTSPQQAPVTLPWVLTIVLVSTVAVFFFLRRRQFIRELVARLEENSELRELFQGDDHQKPTSIKIRNPRDIVILFGRANSAWTRRYFQLKDEYTLQKNTSGSAPPAFDDPLKSRVQGIESIEGSVSQIHQSASDYLPESSTPKAEDLASGSFSPKQAAPEEPTVFYFKQVNNGGFFPDNNKLLDRNQGLFVVNTGMDRNKGMLTLVEENKERIKEALNAAKYKLDPACEQIGNVMAERASDIIVTSRGEVVLNDKGQWEIREKIKVKYV